MSKIELQQLQPKNWLVPQKTFFLFTDVFGHLQL